MKSFFPTLVLILMLSATMIAGTTYGANPSVLNKTVDQVSRSMIETLQLHEQQYIRIKALNYSRFKQAQEISTLYSDDAELLEARYAEIEKDFETKLWSILSKRQQEAYTNFKLTPAANLFTLVQQITSDNKISRK